MRALVIGASSGIGREIAEDLRIQGIEVDAPDASHLNVVYPGHFARRLDGPYDYVVYSAGVDYLEWIGPNASEQKQIEVLDVNLMGFIRMMDELVTLQPGHPARVVVIGSDAAERPMRTSMAYCASKAGVHMAARVAARELGPKGWRINVVAPGMTDETGMQEYVDARVAEVRGWSVEHMLEYEKQQEVVPGRLNTAEVAVVVLNTLTGPDHLNGSIITINGGR